MRIVNRTTFLSMPPGTLYSEYEPVNFGQLCIKGHTTPNDIDFYSEQISDAVDAKGSTEFFDILLRAQETGESFPLAFDSEGRDGQYNHEQRYAVWERADVEALIVRLQRALVESSGHSPDCGIHVVRGLCTCGRTVRKLVEGSMPCGD